MSRIGKMPIAIPAGVTVSVAENNKVTVKGPKGTLERVFPAEMEIKVEGAEATVSRPNAEHFSTTWLLVLRKASRRSLRLTV